MRKLWCSILSVVVICLLSINVEAVSANQWDGTQIDMMGMVPCAITNAEGENLVYDGDFNVSGSMQVLFRNMLVEPNGIALNVNDSKKYVFTMSSNKDVDIRLLGKYFSGSIFANNLKMFTLEIENNESVLSVEGNNSNYELGAYLNNVDLSTRLYGKTSGKVSVTDKKNGTLLIQGATGEVTLETDDFKDKATSKTSTRLYTFGDAVTVSRKGTKISTKGAVKIPSKSNKKIASLYLRPVNQGKNLFMTWTKVKKAKSYVIYRYNTKTKKYKKIGVNKGNEANYFNITKVKNNSLYRFKVRASKSSTGKGKFIGKKSYEVSSLSLGSKKGNAKTIKLNKKTIKGKKGKTVKVKATVKTSTGKKLVSKKVRWFTSKKKVATVSKSGKVTLKKKGTCYIWAKAHNGVNSKKLKVKVK